MNIEVSLQFGKKTREKKNLKSEDLNQKIVELTFLGFLVCESHNGKVDRQIAGMANWAHSFDRSGELVITWKAA